MPITAVGTPTTHAATAVETSFTQAPPAGIADNDQILWALLGPSATAITGTPTGFTLVGAGTTTALNCSVFRKTAASESGSYATTGATLASTRWAGLMWVRRGVDTTTPIDAALSATAGTTAIAVAAITPAAVGNWVEALAACEFASGAATGDVSSTNLTLDGPEAETNVAAATNVKVGLGHFSWSSGAFTPDFTNSTTLTRNLGIRFSLTAAATAAAIPPILVMAPRAA